MALHGGPLFFNGGASVVGVKTIIGHLPFFISHFLFNPPFQNRRRVLSIDSRIHPKMENEKWKMTNTRFRPLTTRPLISGKLFAFIVSFLLACILRCQPTVICAKLSPVLTQTGDGSKRTSPHVFARRLALFLREFPRNPV